MQRASSRTEVLPVHVSSRWQRPSGRAAGGCHLQGGWGPGKTSWTLRGRAMRTGKLHSVHFTRQICCELIVIFQRQAAFTFFLVLFNVSVNYEKHWAQNLGIKGSVNTPYYYVLLCCCHNKTVHLTHSHRTSQSQIAWLDCELPWEVLRLGSSWIAWSLCFLGDLDNILCLEQHALGIIIITALWGDAPMKEGGECVCQVCSHLLRALTSRSHHQDSTFEDKDKFFCFPGKC